MRALVTGASGLLGSHLINQLIEDPKIEHVIALVRNVPNRRVSSSKLTYVPFDLTYTYDKYSILDTYDNYCWFHLAAALSGADAQTLKEANIDGISKLLRKAQELSIPRLIHISSISIYGINHKGNLKEDRAESPVSEYGKSKLAQEQLVKKSKLPWTIVRPPYIIGPGDKNFLYELTKRITKRKMYLVSRSGSIGYIDARDLARGLIELSKIENVTGKVYNIQAGKVSPKNLVNMIGEGLGLKQPYARKLNYYLLFAIARFNEIIKKLQGKSFEKGLSRYRVKTLTSDHTLNTDKLAQDLDFEAKIPIEQSVNDFLQIYKVSKNTS